VWFFAGNQGWKYIYSIMREMNKSVVVSAVAPRRVLLVYGLYSSSLIAYPWILARDGNVVVDTISLKNHVVRHSVWVDSHILVKKPEDFIDRLCDALRERHYDEMICIDEPARTLAFEGAAREEIKPYLPFPPESSLFQVATNKSKFYEWCADLGLDTPWSITCRSTTAVQAAVAKMDYPYVLKGTVGEGGVQVYIVRKPDDLKRALSSEGEGAEWIIQEYLSGAVGTTIFVAREGRLYTHCSVENIACNNNGLGVSAIVRHIENHALEDIAIKVASQVSGLTGYDWMIREDGSYVLIDPHFGRCAPSGACTHLLGVDLGKAYYASISNDRVRSNYHQSGSVVWIFPQVLQLILERGVVPALRTGSPLKKDVKLHLCADGEWRFFLLQLLDSLQLQARVYYRIIRRKLFQS
jgi:hypothetical protein